ncbi:uncharacterized protein LOC100898469 [Galendromus occidentalis]|uniref:Uncharacterized protein LOC100898469 n=1 Tax=Galendromus occidentalis TaxID=34638 RepID=A0AAJ6QTL9_9ACAR|nr:uncharacterized protein LOC100898469 [Galendromus occidentalis]
MASSSATGEDPETIIYEGQKFKDFEELEAAVFKFEYLTYHKYFKAEARTLQSAMRKGIKRVEDNGRFKYYSCLWLCVRGGKPFCRSRGERRSKTIRIGCPSLIRTRISDCGKFFRVMQVVYDHNHGSCPEIYHQITSKQIGIKHEDPQKKSKYVKKKTRLKSSAQAQLKVLLSTVVANEADLTLQESVDKISALYANDLTVAVDDTNNVVALAYCNDKMRALYEEYPEILTIDSSNFIDSLNFTHVILFFVVDSLGEVRPVMSAMILKSNETMYEWLLNEFVRQHPSSANSTLLCLVGEPYTSIDVKQSFTQARVLWEPSQSIQSFKTQLSCRTCHLSETGKRTATDHFQKLIFCPTDQMKHMIKEEFTAVLSISEVVITHFEEVWEPKYRLWNMSTHPYDDSQHEHVLKKMLKLKRHIKTIMTNSAPTHYSIFTRLVDLFVILDDLYYGDVLDKLMKVNQSRYQPKTTVDEAEFKYKGLITEFADMYLRGQFNVFERGIKLGEASTMVTVSQTDERMTKVITSKDGCSCFAYKIMKLPCCHLLSFRIGSQMDLYDERLVHDRWKRNNIRIHGDPEKLVRVPITANDDVIEQEEDEIGKDTLEENMEIQVLEESEHPVPDDSAAVPLGIEDEVFKTPNDLEQQESLDEASEKRLRPELRSPSKAYKERRQQIEELCSEICSVGSGVGGALFTRRLTVLREILDAWQNGSEVCVCTTGSQTFDVCGPL